MDVGKQEHMKRLGFWGGTERRGRDVIEGGRRNSYSIAFEKQ